LKQAPERLESTHSEVEARTINVASNQAEKLTAPSRLNVASIQNRVQQNQSQIRSDYRPLGLNTPWAVDLRGSLPEVADTNDHVRLNRSADCLPADYSPEKVEVPRKTAATCTPIKPAGKPTLRDGPLTYSGSGRRQLSSKHLSLDYTTPWATNRQDVINAKIRTRKLKQRAGGQIKKQEGEKEDNSTRNPVSNPNDDEHDAYQQPPPPNYHQEYFPEPPEPPNYREIVTSLQNNYQECLTRLNTMPLCKDTLRLRQERKDLEFQLGRLEDQIRYASRLQTQQRE